MHALAANLILAKHSSHLMHLLLHFGVVGLFLVSIVDSSFVPLPIPGVTDIMLVLLAAQHQNPILLIAVAATGSALGGWFSWGVGQSGGMAFIEKRTPPRVFKTICGWMESHAILAVAVPAILPPPMPLSPFVLAAGALHMSLKKFMIAFTVSRTVRHTIAVLLGIRYGKAVLHLWFKFSDKYGTVILIVLWAFILISVGIAFYQLWKTSHTVRGSKSPAAA
jgi:membrane protein YqaA with SNARE-associated domain